MWNKIKAVTLKTGQIMEICIVKTPDEFHRNSIASFLSHYSELWLWHLNLALRGKLDELESRFYLGLLEGKIISNVSTWEHGPIGIVGHLFTVEDHRKKGACTSVLKAVIQDFHDRGGEVLIGGFKPISYRIVEKLGFKSIIDKSEVMHLELHPNFKRDYFRAEKAFCRDSMWKDWPGISLLFGIKKRWYLRSMKHEILGPFDYEDYFLEDMKERSKELTVSKVLTTEGRKIVGYATLTCNHHLRDHFLLFDFFLHPSSTRSADLMFKAMDFSKGKTRCFVGLGDQEKRDILLEQGFKEKAGQKQIFTKRDGQTITTIPLELRS